MARIFVAVAWPYASGAVHVGQISGAYLPADIFARYQRMRGQQVLMVSGSDMHGTPISVRAEMEGVPPAEFAARNDQILKETMKRWGITFDLYDSTESPIHKELVRQLFLDLHRKAYIYEGAQVLPYCEVEDRYLPDRYVEGECPHCHFPQARGDQCENCTRLLDPTELINPVDRQGHRPVMKPREHLFFRLSAFQDRLRTWVGEKDHWRSNVLNFTQNWLDEGLKDLAVTRDIDWGIDVPLPGYEDRKIYVWFEAFMGYYTMAVQWARQRGTPEAWREFWQEPECRHYYFLGKDNIRFHTIWWPAVLMALGGLNLPYDVPANEFMNYAGQKFSKSRGNVIPADEALEEYPLDTWRYVLAANMPESRDSNFTYEDLVTRNNSELLATYGNFVHRALTFTAKNFGEVPPAKRPDAKDRAALRTIEEHLQRIGQNLQFCHFKEALREIMALARYGNQYFDAKAPWSLLKENRESCGTALHISLRIVKALAIAAAPYLPESSQELWSMMGYRSEAARQSWEEALEDIPAGQTLGSPRPLFRKLDLPSAGPEDESGDLDIRTARVVGVEDHPQANKLYVLELDLGNERRRIVSGMRENYQREQLLGKDIVLVYNLQPARLRGVESRGMLLAATKGEEVKVLLAPPGVPPGTQVLGQPGAVPLSIERFREYRFTVGPDATALFHGTGRGRGVPLTVEGRPVVVDGGMEEGTEIT